MAGNKILFSFSKLKSKKLKLIVFSALLVLCVSLLKYKGREINYLNSDATWHALYTMKCYDETQETTNVFYDEEEGKVLEIKFVEENR